MQQGHLYQASAVLWGSYGNFRVVDILRLATGRAACALVQTRMLYQVIDRASPAGDAEGVGVTRTCKPTSAL